jgi:hypothetical protein
MTKTTGLRTIFSLGALGLAVLLSLADSAGPDITCATSTFDRTFDVTTDCGGMHAGRLHISYTGTERNNIPLDDGQHMVLSGDLGNLKYVALDSFCEPDQPATFNTVTLDFDHLDGSAEPASCALYLNQEGNAGVACITVGKPETCVASLVAVP